MVWDDIMSGNAAAPSETPIIGVDGDSSGNDLIRVEASVRFNWVPDPGSQFTDHRTGFGYNVDGSEYATDATTMGLSRATGSMTFTDVSSSAPFQAVPTALSFQFDDAWRVSGLELWGDGYSWNPATDTLGGGMYSQWGDTIIAGFDADAASLNGYHWSGDFSIQERGHWVLAPDPQNVEAFGGAGNDTIYGGQGNQLLSGDDGNDILFAGIGSDTLLGGDGPDALHGGTGAQILDGGAGDDTIQGGSGNQNLTGGDGRDLLQAGTGKQTVLGGAGNDTIRGGVGAQLLMGGDGSDSIQAGSGNQTLLGGAGHDVFVLGNDVRGRIVIGDFMPGQDRIEVARGINGLALSNPHDIAARVSSNGLGDAVFHLGGGATVTLSHVSAQRVETHLPDWFRVL